MQRDLNHEDYMKICLKLAEKAAKNDEVPVGAIIVHAGKIIAKAYNKRENSGDATNHAEMMVIKKACKKLGDFRLNDCTMYVSLEPCVMCMGAILNARIGTLVYGASQDKKNIITAAEINERSGLNHKTQIISGVFCKEAQLIVSDYFRSKRKAK